MMYFRKTDLPSNVVTYINKLEKRIHNQRVQLRIDWETWEMRSEARKHYQAPMWFDFYKKRMSEIKNWGDKYHAIQKIKQQPFY